MVKKSATPAPTTSKKEKAEKAEKAEKTEKTEKTEKAGKAEKIDKVEAVDNVEEEEKTELDKLLELFSSLELQVKEIKTQIKAVQKENAKNKKILNKEKARKEKARRSPSGFAKPTKISNEMCDFMKIPRGSEKSRTDVTRSINQYIKTNNLNNPTNKRLIIPDATLKKLLSLKDSEQISFFHMQKYLTPHVKVTSVAAST